MRPFGVGNRAEMRHQFRAFELKMYGRLRIVEETFGGRTLLRELLVQGASPTAFHQRSKYWRIKSMYLD